MPVARFKEILNAEGLISALKFLNANSDYRFAAVYQFRGGELHNVCLIDKEDPSIVNCADVPVEDSYCIFVRNSSQSFLLEHAQTDGRVTNHPKRASVQSYYGVPLISRSGRLMGTACLFDVEPRRASDVAIALLDDAAPLIAQLLASGD